MIRLPRGSTLKGSVRGFPSASRMPAWRSSGASRKRKPPPPAPSSFPARGAVATRRFVRIVDGRVADRGRDRTLQRPAVMQQSPELVEVGRPGQGVAQGVGHVAHLAQDGHAVGGRFALGLQDAVGRSLCLGVDEQDAALELGDRPGRDRNGFHVDAVIRVELDEVDAAVGGRVLILAPDRLPEDVDLDPAGFLGEPLRRDDLALVAVEGLEESDRQACCSSPCPFRPARLRSS